MVDRASGPIVEGKKLYLARFLEWPVNLLVFVLIIIFLLGYFEPQNLLSLTTTTGGDTPSHFYPLKYLNEVLLPKGKVMGWDQGNFAGYPIFYFYFPLPFLLMVSLNLIIPLQVAFKIVSVLGTFLLPFTAFFALRLIGYTFPIPILGSIMVLPFLFHEANSFWGGNILSTLAGEFSYSLGLSLSILFMGTCYYGIRRERYVAINAVLIALIGLAHGYTLLFSGFLSLFFLLTPIGFMRRLWYLTKVHLIGFALMGFWILPLLTNLGFTTGSNSIWRGPLLQVFPHLLWPGIVLAILGTLVESVRYFFLQRKGKRIFDEGILYLWFIVLVCILVFFFAYRIHVLDIRFLPFVQVTLLLMGAIGLGKLTVPFQGRGILALLVCMGVFLFINSQVTKGGEWIKWNYTGFEKKGFWRTFSEINASLSGNFQDPRVVYEHTAQNNVFGSVRAFESLPLFSGRATLEGLHMMSSVTAPFVYYIQSEISMERPCPIPNFNCSLQLNLMKAKEHFKLFNVRDFIVRSDGVREKIREIPEFVYKKSVGPYHLYELVTNENRYVVPLQYEPALVSTPNWRGISYRWFRTGHSLDVPLVFVKDVSALDRNRFKVINPDDPLVPPRIPLNSDCEVHEEIKDEAILIQTTCLNHPLLIKVSYHPNWRVEGADKIYLSSPSFMLVYPRERTLRLTFGWGIGEKVGLALSMVGSVIVLFHIPWVRRGLLPHVIREMKERFDQGFQQGSVKDYLRRIQPYGKLILGGVLSLLVVSFFLIYFFVPIEEPNEMYKQATRYFDQQRYDQAQIMYQRIMERYPETMAASNASFFHALVFDRQHRVEEMIQGFQAMVTAYPESIWTPEGYYRIGLGYVQKRELEKARHFYHYVIEHFPKTVWARNARERLQEMG